MFDMWKWSSWQPYNFSIERSPVASTEALRKIAFGDARRRGLIFPVEDGRDVNGFSRSDILQLLSRLNRRA